MKCKKFTTFVKVDKTIFQVFEDFSLCQLSGKLESLTFIRDVKTSSPSSLKEKFVLK
jgi:uncharacterized protein YlbG (UPF0298 family)